MAAALVLAERGQGQTGRNPSVGCILVHGNRVVGRGWTQPGGRPHAEAMALTQAGGAAKGCTAYVTLEPCAHQSERGAPCADTLIAAGIARLVGALTDPDPRTSGKGYARLRAAGIAVDQHVLRDEAQRRVSGFWSRITWGRPHVTLKLAVSLDGKIAMPDGSSRWITGDAARAHVHLERARADAILVGAGTVAADVPALDVRLPGLEHRSPQKIMLGSRPAPEGWKKLSAPEDIAILDCNTLFIEGGAQTASAFLKADLVDRILLYQAPIIIGDGRACLAGIGLSTLDDAHGQWQRIDERHFGKDRLDIYEAVR